MLLPSYLVTALNYNPAEVQTRPYMFMSVEVPVLGITPAQVNATGGKVIVPAGVYDLPLIVSSFLLRVNSANIGTANLTLQTTEATPVVIATFANAQLTSGALLTPSSTTGVTLGAGFCVKLAPGTGIVLKSSATATGSFTVDLIPLRLSPR